MSLVCVKGTHAAKYRHVRTLLSHNHAARTSLAEMEQQYYSGSPFPQEGSSSVLLLLVHWCFTRRPCIWTNLFRVSVMNSIYISGRKS